MTDERELRKIRALLTKAESTEYPEEAAAFMAKVADLVAANHIDEALLWAEERDESPVHREIVIAAPYVSRKRLLVSGVADALGCTAVAGLPDPSGERVAVIGFRSDVEHVEALVASLMVQMAREMFAAESDHARSIDRTGRAAFRRSFITSYSARVHQRLADAFSAQKRRADEARRGDGSGSSGSSVELVLADRSHEIDAETRRRYPRLRSINVGPSRAAAGVSAGRRAADRAEIGRSVGRQMGRLGA